MATNLRAGLLGLGAMGRNHARVLRELPGVDLVAVADPAGDKFGVAGDLEVLPDVDALVDANIDIAVVAVPTQFHEETTIKLANAGVHTMVEKPIANTVEAATRMVNAFQSAGLVGAVGHIERFNPALQQLRARLEAGDLGDVYQIVTRRQGPFPARIADVGVVLDLGSHDIDLTSWVAQSPFVSVFAQTQTKSGRPHEDMVAIVGRLANGIITSHLVNWLSPIKERLTVVTGERGAFVADTLTGDLTFYANGTYATQWDAVAAFRGVSEGDVTRFAYPKREPLRVEHEAFRDAVLGESQSCVTMTEGLRTLRVIEGILASAVSNDPQILGEEKE